MAGRAARASAQRTGHSAGYMEPLAPLACGCLYLSVLVSKAHC